MIAAVVLAAGAGRRFGGPKQVRVHHGKPLVRWTVEAALGAGCAPVFVVVGAHADETRRAIDGLAVRVLANPGWPEGMASSIRCGVAAAAQEPETAGVLLVPCDVPAIDAQVLGRVLATAVGGDGAIRTTACAYAGTVGTPAVFPRSRFERLMALEGDRGAKVVLLDEPEIARVEWPAGALDVDDPADRPPSGHGL
jgi:molybdenum cofactor cytidylyltransferase